MRLMFMVVIVVLLCLMVVSVQADRLEDLRARYAELARQKLEIENEMIRLEGMFLERRIVEAERLAEEKKEAEVTVEAEIEETETVIGFDGVVIEADEISITEEKLE